MTCFRFFLPAIVLGIMLTMSAPAKSAQFCADSAESIRAALTTAQFANQPIEIRIQQGTYNISNMHGSSSIGQVAAPRGGFTSIGYKFVHHVTITGGWTAGCNTRSLDPALTTINGQNSDRSRLYLRSKSHSITVEGLRFFQTAGLELTDNSGCQSNGQVLRARRLVFQGSVLNHFGTDKGALSFETACHRVRAENNLITGNNISGLKMMCRGNSGVARYRFTHNTIRDVAGWGIEAAPSGASGTCGGNSVGDNGLFNNIAKSIRLTGTMPLVQNNIYDTLSLGAGGGTYPGSTANLTVNPQLDANFRPIEPGSPAINSGTENVPGGLPDTDIEGTTRVIGTHPDRGAFESSVNNLFLIPVTNNNDTGTGSLRAAIEQANASPGLSAIQFDMPGACPRTISLQTPLPNITESLIINGYSQSGSQQNNLENGNNANLCVAIRRSTVVTPSDVPRALHVPGNAGNITLTVRGISFGGFSSASGIGNIPSAIRLTGGSNHRIEGNQFGGIENLANPNGYGIVISGNASAVRIGGQSPGHRNTISNGNQAGVYILGGQGGHEIVNNYIGVRPDGLGAAPNQDGILILMSQGNVIRGNLISGNSRDGVFITGAEASGNLVAGNKIGGRRDHTGILPCLITNSCPPIPTNRKGIMIDNGASDNRIGAVTQAGSPNRISSNLQHAIRIMSGQQNRIRSNQIWNNGDPITDIDLGAFGLNPMTNDCPGFGAPDLANRSQNRAVLHSAQGSGTNGTVTGQISSCATATGGSPFSFATIELFVSSTCNSSGYGPGQRQAGFRLLAIPGDAGSQGQASFTADLEVPFGNLVGQYVTATAMSWDGSTSEFSNCVEIQLADLMFQDRFQTP